MKRAAKRFTPQLDKLRGNIEDLVPGTERETAKAQLSGPGKYEKAVDSFVSTGRGGGRKELPELSLELIKNEGKELLKTSEGSKTRDLVMH